MFFKHYPYTNMNVPVMYVLLNPEMQEVINLMLLY